MILHHSFVGDPNAPHLAFVLHGVLGAGHNLRSFAKKLAETRPDFRFCLIDLRYHGKSLGAPPPHRLESCVDDLFDLVEAIGQAPAVVIGHSLGGKVALRYAKRHESLGEEERGPLPSNVHQLRQIWTLDSDPGKQIPDETHEVYQVVAALKAEPGPFASRADAVAAIVRQGRSTGLANWLATSLEKRAAGFFWLYELPQIEALLADYFSVDEWPRLETLDPTLSIRYELLVAENSDRWSGSMKERASRLAASPRVRVHTLPNSGHWVHVDNPDGLNQIIAEHLI
jgi:esterase